MFENLLDIDLLGPLQLNDEFNNFTFNPETEENQLGLSGLRADAFDVTLFSNDEIQEIETIMIGGNNNGQK